MYKKKINLKKNETLNIKEYRDFDCKVSGVLPKNYYPLFLKNIIIENIIFKYFGQNIILFIE